MKKQYTKFAVAALCAALSTVSFAQVSLAPNGLDTLSIGSTTDAANLLNNDTNATYIVDPFSGVNAQGTVVFTGTLYEGYWHNTVTGGMDFYFGVYNDSTSADSIADLTFTHYAGFTTSVAQFALGSAAATYASRDNTGDIINFNYLNYGNGYNTIAPGTWSDEILIMTNATATTIGSAQIQDGGNVVVPIVGPAAVPEPAPMSVLALGGLVFLRRRKKA